MTVRMLCRTWRVCPRRDKAVQEEPGRIQIPMGTCKAGGKRWISQPGRVHVADKLESSRGCIYSLTAVTELHISGSCPAFYFTSQKEEKPPAQLSEGHTRALGVGRSQFALPQPQGKSAALGHQQSPVPMLGRNGGVWGKGWL